jgi:hypothetical protein
VVEQVILYIASDRLDDAMLEADKANFGKARSLVNTNKTFIDSNRVYVTSSAELQRMDSTNLSYLEDLNGAETKSAVTIKYLQKSNRAGNYKIRNKKE